MTNKILEEKQERKEEDILPLCSVGFFCDFFIFIFCSILLFSPWCFLHLNLKQALYCIFSCNAEHMWSGGCWLILLSLRLPPSNTEVHSVDKQKRKKNAPVVHRQAINPVLRFVNSHHNWRITIWVNCTDHKYEGASFFFFIPTPTVTYDGCLPRSTLTNFFSVFFFPSYKCHIRSWTVASAKGCFGILLRGP